MNMFLVSDPHVSSSAAAATALGMGVGVGVGVFPFITTPPVTDDDRGGGIQLWQNQQSQTQMNFLKKGINFDQDSMNLLDSTGGGGGGGTLTCQDCGNQAKKDCSHRRCRTCCKSRGYDCTTHVKSTWVPAARRRERQMMAAAVGGGVSGGGGASSGSTSGGKKPRLIGSQNTTTSHTSTSNTPPRSFDTSSSHHHQDASFKESLPGQVRAPAVFKCVRVTAVDDGQDEYAYQAAVKIGGHVFKGFLYDQGLEPRDGSTFPNFSDLHLGATTRNGASSSSPLLDPLDLYGGSGGGGGGGGGFLGGSNYANTMN